MHINVLHVDNVQCGNEKLAIKKIHSYVALCFLTKIVLGICEILAFKFQFRYSTGEEPHDLHDLHLAFLVTGPSLPTKK